MGAQSPVLTGQRASWREIQGMYTSYLWTCFYTCSSSPAMVLHSSTNYSPSNEALFLYLFGNTTASNISTPKAYMQFFFLFSLQTEHPPTPNLDSQTARTQQREALAANDPSKILLQYCINSIRIHSNSQWIIP